MADVAARALLTNWLSSAPSADVLRAFELVAGGDPSLAASLEVHGSVDTVSLRSQNYPSHTWRVLHRDEVRIAPGGVGGPGTAFKMVPGLTGTPGAVSFESATEPGHYLRHCGYWLRCHANDRSDLFLKDASFVPRPALTGSQEGHQSFESVNYPAHYICHRGYKLKIDRSEDSDLHRNDASFRVEGAAAATLWQQASKGISLERGKEVAAAAAAAATMVAAGGSSYAEEKTGVAAPGWSFASELASASGAADIIDLLTTTREAIEAQHISIAKADVVVACRSKKAEAGDSVWTSDVAKALQGVLKAFPAGVAEVQRYSAPTPVRVLEEDDLGYRAMGSGAITAAGSKLGQGNPVSRGGGDMRHLDSSREPSCSAYYAALREAMGPAALARAGGPGNVVITEYRQARGGREPWQWCGWQQPVPEGLWLRMSVWIHFEGSVPGRSGNFGLKIHGDVRNSWLDDLRADTWRQVCEVAPSRPGGDGNHLLLIFDSAPGPFVARFAGIRAEVYNTREEALDMPPDFTGVLKAAR